VTRGDVIPVCLFGTPPPPNLMTVRACRECNEAKAKNDDYLRDILAFERECSEHPVAKELFRSKVTRSMTTNRRTFAREVVERSEPVLLLTPGGIIFEQACAVPLDVARIDEIMTTIAKGIYARMVGRRMPDGCTFEVHQVRRLHADMVIEHCQKLG